MAKAVTATKGGVTVTGGYLDVTNVRLLYYFDPVIDPNVPVKKWICEWKLYESITEAQKAFNTGRAMDQGEIQLPYVAGNDPVQDAYEILTEEFEKKWELAEEHELP